MLDLGTGTGRLLEIFAPLYRRGVGIDMSREMLTVARANLDKAGVANAQVRQGDIFAPPVERDAFDLVTIHQVLHYLDDPARAIREAARLLRPRRPAGHRRFRPARAGIPARRARPSRLGFSDRQIAEWLDEAGLDSRRPQDFEPRGTAKAKLTVKLWLGRDRRLLIADPSRQCKPQWGNRLMNQFRLSTPSRHWRQDPRLVRVLPAEDRRDGSAAVGHRDPAGAAEAALRVGDLWRRRLDARAHGAHGQAHPRRRSTLTPAAHLTCVDASRDEVDQVIAEFAAMGVKRFVALRGDPAEGVGAPTSRIRTAMPTAPSWSAR